LTPKNIANAGNSVNEPAWGVRLWHRLRGEVESR
jgi:hypothetical protein